MAYDYANDAAWGADWRNALVSGNQALMQRYQAIMDAQPQAAQQVGMISAKTADMGRGSNVFASGGNGLEYNTAGQYRTPGAGAWNSMNGSGGYAVNPGQVQGAPIGGALDATPAMTQAQYGQSQRQMYGASPTGGAGNSFDQNTINRFYRQGAPETTKPLATSQPPQWNSNSVFGQGGQPNQGMMMDTHGMYQPRQQPYQQQFPQQYGSQSGGMWGGGQHPLNSNLGFGGSSNYTGQVQGYGNPYGGYSSYGGAQRQSQSYNPYGNGTVAYRRGLLG